MGRYRIRPARSIPAFIVAACLAGLLLWGLWVSAAWAKNAVMQRVVNIKSLTGDEINETADVTGLVIRTEEPFQAPAAGVLSLKVRDGERVRSGALVAEIKGLYQTEVRSSRAGVFCTHVDGLESLLQPKQIDALNLPA
ncbi:MAG: hypothetical protein FWC60_09995, partial [Firmicutes bacterium]|nr:hypothetical protein [Bacillota bacterium]